MEEVGGVAKDACGVIEVEVGRWVRLENAERLQARATEIGSC